MILQTENLEITSYHKTIKWKLARNSSLFFIVVLLSLFLYYLLSFYQISKSLIFLGSASLISINFFFLYYKNHFQYPYYILLLNGLILCSYTLYLPEFSHYIADCLWRFTMIILAFIGINKKAGWWMFGYFAIELVVYFSFFDLNTTEFKALFNDNKLLFIITILTPFFVNTYLIYNFIQLQKAAHLKIDEAYKNMTKTNEENVMLLKEIHHRVKNNLQIVTSLLRLQKNELKSEDAIRHYETSIDRVLAMASIHEKLYQQNQLSQLKLEPYIKELAEELKKIYAPKIKIDMEYKFEKNNIALNTIIPLGLIINELLTNTFKYAFLERTSNKPTLVIEIYKTNSGFELIYMDNGKWLQSKASCNFGTELIGILTEQLKGKYQLNLNQKGTVYNFKFEN